MNSFLRQFYREEDGTIAAIIAFMLFAILGFAAAAIDMGYANSTRTELQVAASAAALAGVQQIVDADENGVADNDDYRHGAVEFAYRNMTASKHGNVLEAICGSYDPVGGQVTGSSECSDVKVGNWDPDTRTFTAWDDPGFTPGSMDLDGVRVLAHRSQSNGNPLGLFLAPAVGLAEQEINVSAIAWADVNNPLDCYQRGIIAFGMLDMDSNNTYTDGICLYGEEGVKIQSDNCFQGPNEGCGEGTQDPGVEVMTPPPPNWDEQGGPNPGFDDAKEEGNQDPQLAQRVEDFIDAVQAGFFGGTWSAADFNYDAFANPGTGGGLVEDSIPASGPVPGTIYDMRGQTADIPKGDWGGFAIWADNIKVQSDTSLHNAILLADNELVVDGDIWSSVLASRDLMKLGSNICIGHDVYPLGVADGPVPKPCDGDTPPCDAFSVGIYSQGKFTIQSNTMLRNTQLITGYQFEEFDLQSNNTYEGVTIQSMGNINLGSNNSFSGCQLTPEGAPTGEVNGLVVRLVD